MSAYRCYTARRPVKDDVRLHFRNQMHRLQVGVPRHGASSAYFGVGSAGLIPRSSASSDGMLTS